MTVRIRPMRLADVAAVLPLEQELFAGDPPWTAEIFRSELAGMPGTRWYVVAEATGPAEAGETPRRIVGYAGVRVPTVEGEPADVHTLAVEPRWQRHGLGSRLLAALTDEAVAYGAGTLMLEVRADNDAALAFYAAHGFEQMAVRPGYYGGNRDGLVLGKPLGHRSPDDHRPLDNR